MKSPLTFLLFLLLAAIYNGCASSANHTGNSNEMVWQSKATTLPQSSYNRQEDSLLLVNYWLTFKDDVLTGRVAAMSGKMPLHDGQQCLPFDSTLSEQDRYWAYQVVLANLLASSETSEEETMVYLPASRHQSMLVVTKKYQQEVRPQVSSAHELNFYLVRDKNKLGISGTNCLNTVVNK